MSSSWVRLFVKSYKSPKPDVVIIGHLGQFDIHLARLRYPRVPLILDYMISGADTALDRGITSGFKLRLLQRIDNAALKKAQIIVVDTQAQGDRIPQKYAQKICVVPVGASAAWFKEEPNHNGDDDVSVVFFGNYTPLQGATTIGAALSLVREPINVTMIGSGQDEADTKLAASLAGNNVHITWKDWVDSDKLPGVVAAHAVCLGIFGDSPKAQRVVPNKVFQGAAAGCAIITSDTEPQKDSLKDAALFVPSDDAHALARALDTLSKNRAQLESLQQKAKRRAAESFTAEKVIRPLLNDLTTL